MKRTPFYLLLLKGIGYIVLGNVMCLFVTMGLTMFGSNLFMNILGIICCTAIFFMLIFTVAWKDGTHERKLLKNHVVESELKYRWIFIGIIMFVVAAAPTIVLLLNKLFFPEEDTFFLYRFISGSAFPFIQTFVPVPLLQSEEATAWTGTTLRQIDNMDIMFPILMIVYYALIPAVTQFGYWMGFNDKLSGDKIMYR